MTVLHPTFDILTQTARRLRVELPAEGVVEYERLLAILERTGDDAPSVGDYRSALTECVTDGGDPYTSPEVVELAARVELSGSDVRESFRKIADRLLAEHAVTLFAAFTDRFDEAAGILADNASNLRSVSRLRAAPDTDAMDRVRYADEVIARIWSLWSHLSVSRAAPFPTAGRHKILVIADVAPEDWFALRPDRDKLGRPWQVAVVGLDFSLATPSTFRRRVAALGEWTTEQVAQQRREQAGAHRSKPSRDPLAWPA